MTASQNHVLSELSAGHSGAPISAPARAYFQQRLQNRIFNFLINRLEDERKLGLTQAALARRIGKKPDIISRWLSSPSNLTLDTISDLLIGMSAEELVPTGSSPLGRVKHNYSHYAELASAASAGNEGRRETRGTQPREGAAKAAVNVEDVRNKMNAWRQTR